MHTIGGGRMMIDDLAFEIARETYRASNLVDSPSWEDLPLREQIKLAVDLQSKDEAPKSPPTIWDLPAGIHHGVPESVYHARKLGVVNKSALDKIHKTPAHYRAWVDWSQDEETPALAFGKALHCAVLEPEVFALRYVVQPGFGDLRTKEGKVARDAWLANNASKIAITAEDAKRIDGIRASLAAHPKAALLIGGQSEVTLRWDDADTGLPCKARADYYRPDLDACIDLKTTIDASPDGFAKSCANYRYHVQQAHYSEGFVAIGKPLDAFVFVAVEKDPPYACAFYVLDAEGEEMGVAARRADMDRFAECMNTGEFPSYDTGIIQLTLPRWTK
jgi:hypothetical protein